MGLVGSYSGMLGPSLVDGAVRKRLEGMALLEEI